MWKGKVGLKWIIVLNYRDCLIRNHMLAFVPQQSDVRGCAGERVT